MKIRKKYYQPRHPSAFLLRRQKLGRTSTKGIQGFLKQRIPVYRYDRGVPDNPNLLCIRWGCTAETMQKNYLNSPKSITLANDKTEFRRLLEKHKLCTNTAFDDFSLAALTFPIIVRPRVHAQGKQLYFCEHIGKANIAISHCGEGWYANEFIKKHSEYRVCFGSGRVLWVARKYPADENAVAWNVARGGRFENVRFDDWPLKVIRKCKEAYDLSTLDFGGVDVMLDYNANSYILEMNSAPSLTSPYRQECMAKYFDYVIAHGKAVIPITEAKGGYLKFIHPCIDERAIV